MLAPWDVLVAGPLSGGIRSNSKHRASVSPGDGPGRLAYIRAVVCGALVEFAGFTCPLTLLENDLRRRAGEAGYRGGFIDHYLARVIYPPGLTRGMQIGLGLLVLLVAIIGYLGFARRHLPVVPISGVRSRLGRWLARG